MAATAAAIGVLGGVRLPVAAGGVAPLPLRSTSLLSPRCYSSSSFSLPLGFAPLILSDARKASFHVRASSEERSSPIETDELFSDLKAKWDAVENKSAVFLYGGGALVAVWLSTIIVGAINSVPLLPKLMELVGLGYTGWFVYRYLLFKSCRKELIEDIETLKKKIAGTGD